MGFRSDSMVKNLPAVQETQVWSLNQKDLLEEDMATHSSILAWRVPWTEVPGRLQSMGSQSRTWPKWLSTCASKIWSLGSDEWIQGRINSFGAKETETRKHVQETNQLQAMLLKSGILKVRLWLIKKNFFIHSTFIDSFIPKGARHYVLCHKVNQNR